MPLCEISLTKGALSRKKEGTLINALSNCLLDAEGLEPGEITREMCSFAIDRNGLMVSGNGKRQPRKAIVKVHYLAGAIEPVGQNRLIRGITDAIREACKSIEERDIWCILIPIQDGSFGVAGNPVSPELIRSIANANK